MQREANSTCPDSQSSARSGCSRLHDNGNVSTGYISIFVPVFAHGMLGLAVLQSDMRTSEEVLTRRRSVLQAGLRWVISIVQCVFLLSCSTMHSCTHRVVLLCRYCYQLQTCVYRNLPTTVIQSIAWLLHLYVKGVVCGRNAVVRHITELFSHRMLAQKQMGCLQFDARKNPVLMKVASITEYGHPGLPLHRRCI